MHAYLFVCATQMAMSRALKAATSYTEQVLPGMGGQEPPQLPGGMHY